MAKATADNLINEYALEYKKLLGIIQYKLSEDDMALKKPKTKPKMSKEEDYAKRKEDSEKMAKEETEVVKDEL